MQLVDSKSALESERTVLELTLLDNANFYQLERLRPEDFQNSDNRQIFTVLRDRIKAGQTVDHVILYDHFAEDNCGIANVLLDMDRGFTSNGKIEPHILSIIRCSHRRKIISTLQAALAQANDMSEDNVSVLSVTCDRLLEVAEYAQTSKSLRLNEFSDAFYSRIERIANQDASVGGFTTGIVALDEMTTGLRAGEYVIVGAYTGEGKSSFVTQIMTANCAFGVKVLLFSQEMSKEAVLSRIIPQVTKGNLPAFKLRNPRKMIGSDRAIFAESKAIVDGWDLWVNDASTMHASELVSHAHTMVRKHGVQLIVVDYLQLMKADGEKRYEQVSAASAALRELAKGQNVVVIAVSQLARPEGKLKRQPTIWDLKQSGEIENDAHLVLFPFRPVDKKGQLTGKDFIVIGKQREGPVGRIPVEFDRDRLMFVGRADSDQQEDPVEVEAWYNK